MDSATFDKFRRLIYEKSGISLSAGKEALLCARVGKRLRALGMDDHRAYLKYVTEDSSGDEVVLLLDAISTNVTSFFRESAHFDFTRDVFTQWLQRGQRRFRFWSAACSTGEEPYTLAMTLLSAANGEGAGLDMKILATDISTRVLDVAKAGQYSAEKVQTIPPRSLETHFERQQNGKGPVYVARESLKRMIVFKRLNLSTPPFPMQGPLDIIFCRNVMIYFDNDVRRRMLAEMFRLLKPGGYLMVGHAESLTGMVSDFTVVRPSIYIKK